MKRSILFSVCILFAVLNGAGSADADSDTTWWVNTFDEEFVNWASTHVETYAFPPPNLYESVYCHMTIGCPHDPGDCDPWDRYGTLQIRHPDTDSTHTDYEIMRFVTPYDITYGDPSTTCSWTVDVTDYQFLLHDDVTLTLFIDSWIGGDRGWLITVDFEMNLGVPGREAFAIENLWQFGWINYGDPDNPIEDHVGLLDVETPPDATGAKVRTYSTGHGFWNTNNAAEFSYKWQQLHVDADSTRHHLWRPDCDLNPCSPQQGTWTYDRAGWCPGDKADAWEVDVSAWVTPGALSTYHFKFQPYENWCRPNNPECVDETGCECAGHAYYRFRSQVIFYRRPSVAAVEEDLLRQDRGTLQLTGSYPNPSSPQRTIAYRLEEPGEVVISIYDAQGARVHSVTRQHATSGPFAWSWDGLLADGQEIGAGVYVCEVRYGRERVSAKMLIVN